MTSLPQNSTAEISLKQKKLKSEKYIVVSEGCEWGRFDSLEEAYNFAVDHVHFLKMACGDIYVPYSIIKG